MANILEDSVRCEGGFIVSSAVCHHHGGHGRPMPSVLVGTHPAEKNNVIVQRDDRSPERASEGFVERRHQTPPQGHPPVNASRTAWGEIRYRSTNARFGIDARRWVEAAQ
jgi:hypothetical protein